MKKSIRNNLTSHFQNLMLETKNTLLLFITGFRRSTRVWIFIPQRTVDNNLGPDYLAGPKAPNH